MILTRVIRALLVSNLLFEVIMIFMGAVMGYHSVPVFHRVCMIATCYVGITAFSVCIEDEKREEAA